MLQHALDAMQPAAHSADDLGIAEQARNCDHPQVAFFHLFFRTAAILTYVFCTWFSANFVRIFIVCVLLLAFDFWTVKNVSGRLLVGLRWWNEILPDGSSEWRFESADVRARAPRTHPARRRGAPSHASPPRAPRRADEPAASQHDGQ